MTERKENREEEGEEITMNILSRRTKGEASDSSNSQEEKIPRSELDPEGKIPRSELTSEDHGAGGHNDLHRGLKARHITMIAIGGAIGTGLIIGT